MASQEYERQLKEKKIFVLPDVFPWSGIHIQDTAVIDALVTGCSVYTGANVGSADMSFPKKVFGDHIRGLTPIKICVGDLNNVFFRGFINEEDASLGESGDSVKAKAVDYKWYFSKCTRIRGRWYSTSGEIPTAYGSPNTQGNGKLKFEMYRGDLSSNTGLSGYLQNQPCVFNEGGLPTCLTNGRAGNQSIFKMRKLYVELGVQKIQKQNFNAKYWTFSSILSHIIYWWLQPYGGTYSPIKISSNSFAELSQLSEQDSIPIDLSIEGMNPLDAIDTVVKAIPGKWIWFLSYQGTQTNINIKNVGNNFGPWKKLYIGDGSKQALNPANVADVSVSRKWDTTSSFVVIKGGKMKLTTTVELQPTWEKHTVSGIANLPFTSVADYEEWKKYYLAKKKEKMTTAGEKTRFQQAFRHYCIPSAGEFLTTALQGVTFKPSMVLTGRLKTMYAQIETDLRKMFAKKVNVKRELLKPCHVEFDNPIFFAFDNYRQYCPKSKTPSVKYTVDPSKALVVYDKGYNFESETGLVIFEEPQYCRFDTGVVDGTKVESEPDENTETPTFTDKNRTSEKAEWVPNSVTDIGGNGEVITVLATRPLISRRIFCTLSITLDMPYMVGSDVFGLAYEEGGNFARYVDMENIDLNIHANAFYPVMPNKKATFTPKAFTLASGTGKDFPVNITADMCGKVLYPAETMTDYQMFPNNSDTILLKKLDNFVSAINKFDEAITANLGTLDTTYRLGDMITSIENTYTENIGSGYYGLNDYVSQVSISIEGQVKAYSTTLTVTNDIGFTPKDYDKEMKQKLSLDNAKFSASSFLTEEEK